MEPDAAGKPVGRSKKKTKRAKSNKPKKRPVGRPSDYRPEYAQALLEYFSEKPYKTISVMNGLGIEVDKVVATDFKSLAGFAIEIGVARSTISLWAVEKNEDGNLKHPEFSEAYARAKDFQENFLVVNANKNLINPRFAEFTAKNVINWRGDPKEPPPPPPTQPIQSQTEDELNLRLKAILEKADPATRELVEMMFKKDGAA